MVGIWNAHTRSQRGRVRVSYYQSEDKRTFAVVVSQTGRYSIRPIDCECFFDWREVGKTGTRDECLAYVGELMAVGYVRSADAGDER